MQPSPVLRRRSVSRAVFSGLLLCGVVASTSAGEPEWVYIQNDRLKAGVRKDAGACLGYFAGADGKNVLNSYDHGRFIQQSYYGKSDGSRWGARPWRYNPVQGGDYQGNASSLLEFRAESDRLTQGPARNTGRPEPSSLKSRWSSGSRSGAISCIFEPG